MDDNPYASPRAPVALHGGSAAYNSAKLWADLAVYVVIVAVIAQGVGLYIRGVSLWELQEFAAGTLTDLDTYEGVNRATRSLLAFADISLVFGALAVPAWMAAAHRNLPGLGARELRYSAAECVIVWFIPGVNLVAPRRALRELWQASQALTWEPPGTGWKRLPVPVTIDLWWMFMLLAGFGMLAFRGLMLLRPTLQMVVQGYRALLLAEFLAMIAGLLLARLIREISDAQETRYSLVNPGVTEREDVSPESIPSGE